MSTKDRDDLRQEIIERYENIKSKWDNCPRQTLKTVLPEQYKIICAKLEALKQGKDFTVVDKTDELKTAIAYIGGQIPSINYKIINGEKVLIGSKNEVTWEQAREIAAKY